MPVRRGKGGGSADEQKVGFVYCLKTDFFGGLEKTIKPRVNIQPERTTPSYQLAIEGYDYDYILEHEQTARDFILCQQP